MYGVRVMKWQARDDYPSGLYFGSPWPEAHQIAVCKATSTFPKHSPEDTPKAECTCGIYAFRSFWLAECCTQGTWGLHAVNGWKSAMFAVLVNGYGKMILHETGWRAAEAEVVGICTLWGEPLNRDALSLATSAACYYQVPLLSSWDVIRLLKATNPEYSYSGPLGETDAASPQ